MRARIANSGMDFWAMLGAAALATLLLVAATQLQAQTYPVPHNFSRHDCVVPARSAICAAVGICARPLSVYAPVVTVLAAVKPFWRGCLRVQLGRSFLPQSAVRPGEMASS
jgi:hypothetical protein